VEPALRKAQELLRHLSLCDLHAVIPVLEKYDLCKGDGGVRSAKPAPDYFCPLPGGENGAGEQRPAVPFSEFAEHLETLVSMMDSPATDISAPECAAIGTFICNKGTKEENAEALLALMPVATRVFLRWDEAVEAERKAARAAVEARRDAKPSRSNVIREQLREVLESLPDDEVLRLTREAEKK